MNFQGNIFWRHLLELLPYVGTTLFVAAASFAVALFLAVLTVMGNLGHHKIARIIARGYLVLMRCVPPIVLLFVVYYGAPHLLRGVFGIEIEEFSAVSYAIVALGLLHGAGLSELMRSAYEAVDRGQREAAVSIGLSGFQAFYRIIFPQALVVALPGLGNSIVSLLKDGALAYSIGVIDITGRATYLISKNLGGYVVETYLALALLYWMLSLLVQKGFGAWENRLQKG